MSIEQDSFGFPILPEIFDMDDEIRAERRARGLRYTAKRRLVEVMFKHAEPNLLERQLMEVDTSLVATEALARLGLLPKIVKLASQFGEDAGAETRINETARFGVHWCATKDTDRVYAAIDLAWFEADGTVSSFGTVLYGLDWGGFTEEEVHAIETIADSIDF